MPSGSLMASVRMTYPFATTSPRSDLADGLLGTALDGLLGSGLQSRWDIGCYRHRVTVVGQAEHVRTQRRAHAVTATALVVDRNSHAGVNSRCSSVRPRRM